MTEWQNKRMAEQKNDRIGECYRKADQLNGRMTQRKYGRMEEQEDRMAEWQTAEEGERKQAGSEPVFFFCS